MFLISYLPTVVWIQGFRWLFCGFRKMCNHRYLWCSGLSPLLLWGVFFSGIGAVVSEVYLHLRRCWQRGPSLVTTILTSWNLFLLAIQRSVTNNGEYNEVISVNDLNGIAKRFGDIESFEHTQRCNRQNLDFCRRYSIYSLLPNRNW